MTTHTAPVFSYIHVPGCSCTAPDYPERLAAAREQVAVDYPQPDHATWIAEQVPDGSCLAWLDTRGQGWPAAHRDYHLMSLYERAIALRGTGEAAWGPIAAHRADPGNPGWPRQTQEQHDEDVRLCDLHSQAQDAEWAACAAVTCALAEAPRGAQPDGSFVTRCALYCGGEREHHTLHAPGKQGPLVEARDDERRDADGRLGLTRTALRTREEARAIREQERANHRAAEDRYATARRAASVHLRNGGLPYAPGMKGGSVRLPSGDAVSARGALRHALGCSRDEADRILSASLAAVNEAEKPRSDAKQWGYVPPDLILTVRGIANV